MRICGFAVLVGLVAGLVARAYCTDPFLHEHLLLREVLLRIQHSGPQPSGSLGHADSADRRLAGRHHDPFWEPTLKGHGIPEAMESVLFGHSRMRLRVALLKPLATAFAIGTGGPFGAEGPIIQTGAALGSLFGRRSGLRHTTAAYCLLPEQLPVWRLRLPLRWQEFSSQSNCSCSSCALGPLFLWRSQRRSPRGSDSFRGMGAPLPYSNVPADGDE